LRSTFKAKFDDLQGHTGRCKGVPPDFVFQHSTVPFSCLQGLTLRCRQSLFYRVK